MENKKSNFFQIYKMTKDLIASGLSKFQPTLADCWHWNITDLKMSKRHCSTHQIDCFLEGMLPQLRFGNSFESIYSSSRFHTSISNFQGCSYKLPSVIKDPHKGGRGPKVDIDKVGGEAVPSDLVWDIFTLITFIQSS
jgi:hypothetical protein